MGLYQGKVHGQSVVEHYGSISGYRSTLTQYPDLGLGFALLTNSNEGERLCAWLRGILSDGAHGASVPDKRWEEQSVHLAVMWNSGDTAACRVKLDSTRYYLDLTSDYDPIPASAEQLLGIWSSPGFLTWSLSKTSNLSSRPQCVTIPFAPACYGDLNPVFASVGGGRFAACFRYTLRDSGGVLYGYPFSAKKEGEYLLVYGLSFSRWGCERGGPPYHLCQEGVTWHYLVTRYRM
jgi:hypothetical protein